MSLISDALKEAQKKRGDKRATLSTHPSLPSPEKKRKRPKPFFALAIFAVVLLLFSIYFYLQLEKIMRVRSIIVEKPYDIQSKVAPKEPIAFKEKKEEKEAKEVSENAAPVSLPAESPKNERKEEKMVSQVSPVPLIPPPPKIEEKRITPQKAKERIPELGEEVKKDSQIEIIRSLISSKKPMDEELLQIEEAEKIGDWRKACALWEKIIEKEGRKEYFLNAGLAFKNTGDLKKAEELFLRALQIDPNYLPSLNNLGVLYLEKGLYEKANEYFLKALELSPQDPEIYVNLGISFFKSSNFQKARQYFEEALKLNNKLYQPYYYLGIICLNQNEKEKALSNFQRLLEFSPPDFPPELKNWVKTKIEQLKPRNP